MLSLSGTYFYNTLISTPNRGIVPHTVVQYKALIGLSPSNKDLLLLCAGDIEIIYFIVPKCVLSGYTVFWCYLRQWGENTYQLRRNV